MANNRLFLVHRPTQVGLMLAKRMGWGWYCTEEKNKLEKFFEYLANNPEGSQDDFILVLENAKDSTCFEITSYTNKKKDGFRIIDFEKLDESNEQ